MLHVIELVLKTYWFILIILDQFKMQSYVY